MAKLSIYKYVRTAKGWRYCKAAFHPNGKIKPTVVVVSGVEEKHTEGRYFLNFNSEWIDVGLDSLEAQRKRLDEIGVSAKDITHFLRHSPIARKIRREKDGIRTEAFGANGRHRGTHAQFPRLVRRRADLTVFNLWAVHVGNRYLTRPVRVFKEFAAQMAPTLFPSLPS